MVQRFVRAFVAFVGLGVPGTFAMALLLAPPAKPPSQALHSFAAVLQKDNTQDLAVAAGPGRMRPQVSRAASNAGRSTSVSGKVNSTTADTTISVGGTPSASPSRP
jgi:hypothetical protein